MKQRPKSASPGPTTGDSARHDTARRLVGPASCRPFDSRPTSDRPLTAMGRLSLFDRLHPILADTFAKAGAVQDDVAAAAVQLAAIQLAAKRLEAGPNDAVPKQWSTPSGVHRPWRCLDLGCNDGRLVERLGAGLARGGIPGDVIGLDIDGRRFPRRQSWGQCPSRGQVETRFVRADMTALPLHDDTFDVVVATLAMHHLHDQARHRSLAEACRVLRPGGALILVDCAPGTSAWMRLLGYSVGLVDGFARTRRNRTEGLAGQVRQCGFDSVEVTDHYRTAIGSLATIRATKTTRP